jgi:hypothetical protein
MPSGSQQGCIAESGSRLPHSKAFGGYVHRKISRANLDLETCPRMNRPMKTTVDMPPGILARAERVAATRGISISNLIVEGLETVLRAELSDTPPADALARLRKGYHLGGQPLTRDQAHAR